MSVTLHKFSKSLWAKIFYSVITKNSNWEILPKNLVTFKRSDCIKDEKLWYFGDSVKDPTFREGGGSRIA